MRTIATSEDGNLILDLGWLLAESDEDTLMHIYDCLSCQEVVIRNVADQIINGWTDMSSHGLRDIDIEAEPTTAIDYALRKMCKLSGERAKAEIEKLEQRILKIEANIKEHNDKMYEQLGCENANAYTVRTQ